MQRILSAPGRVGPTGGHEGTRVEKSAARPGFALVGETPEGIRSFEKGSNPLEGCVQSDWDCPAGHYNPRVDETKPDAVACEKCGEPCTERPYRREKVDWFEEKCGAQGWYDDAGLGVRFYSGQRKLREQILKDRGYVCVLDTGEQGDAFARREAEQQREEDATVREMLAEDWNGKFKADTRTRVDDGRTTPEYDPRKWMKDLGVATE